MSRREPATVGGYHASQGRFGREGAPGESRGPSAPPLLGLDDATLGYGQQAVLRHVTLAVRAGDFLGIVGPNGSGKSTLLKTILGLLPPLSGRVTRSPGLRFGYVPQRDGVDLLFPLSVRQVVAMGRYGRVGLFRRLRRADWEEVDAALEQTGIADLGRRDLAALSGGQRQRTLIARALAGEPDLLVLDEPTTGMDLAGEAALLELIDQLHDVMGITVLMVTHLLSNVANHAERIAIIAEGEIEAGDQEEMLTEERLSRLYGMPVSVERLHGRVVIAPGAQEG